MLLSNFKLGIGIPLSYHLVPSAFFDSFITMEKPDFLYFRTSSASIEEMRNIIVRDALAGGCSHLLMLDTDQFYPVDTVTRLLSHKKAVVGARIRRRYPPFDNLMMRGHIGAFQTIRDYVPGDLIEVDATGAGCVLYETRVFRTIPPPWFESDWHDGKPVGEDYKFCAKLKTAGYPIHVDTGLYVTHLTQMGVSDGLAQVYEKIDRSVQETIRQAQEDPQPLR